MLTVLKVLGVVIILIALLKVTLGANADVLLDGTIPQAASHHPSVDSQVRFYGAAFSVYGVLLWVCSNDMTRYETIFKALMIVFFVGGVARLLGAIVRGKPSAMIMALWALEIVVPPLLLWWQSTLAA